MWSPTMRIRLLMRRRDSILLRVRSVVGQKKELPTSATSSPELTISTWAILPAGSANSIPIH